MALARVLYLGLLYVLCWAFFGNECKSLSRRLRIGLSRFFLAEYGFDIMDSGNSVHTRLASINPCVRWRLFGRCVCVLILDQCVVWTTRGVSRRVLRDVYVGVPLILLGMSGEAFQSSSNSAPAMMNSFSCV